MLKMSWLNGLQLEQFVKKYGDTKTKKAFMGVFAIDTLPTQLPHLPILLIINTHTVNLPGEHWKAVYISRERNGEVFDSLAGPISIRLQQWMNKFTRRWKHCKLIVQHPLSPTCGAFVLYFILRRLSVSSMKTIMTFYTRNLSFNDYLMCQFVHQFINKA